jgi:GH15 family glucan-1,4-alpha-glucosidase
MRIVNWRTVSPIRATGEAADVASIADYALLADCHSAALVARDGSVDWCCMPRYDTGSMFGALLDPEAGSCTIEVEGGGIQGRAYLDGTLVLESTLEGEAGEARLLDFMPFDDPLEPAREHRALLRIVEGVRGAVTLRVRVAPRFDYGEVVPWLRHHGRGVFSAIGGDDGLLCHCDGGFEADGDGGLTASATVRGGERFHVLLASRRPEELDGGPFPPADPARLDAALDDTLRRWREWSKQSRHSGVDAKGVLRSAAVLKGLCFAPSGAMVAAPTTSLPESLEGGEEHRTWDYRYSWIRDAALAAHCLTELGFDAEAHAFRRFIERSAAGSAKDLRVCYGVGGERRLEEMQLDMAGYRGKGPVRAGNAAGPQLQLDAYGHLLHQSFTWSELGHPPDDDYWRFILDLVNAAAEKWEEPDRGIWEWRGEPMHFVHSKVLCWVALDRGIQLAESSLRRAPVRRWREAREAVKEAVLEKGFDAERGTFVQAFGEPGLDAAILRLPSYRFIPYDDERMLSTVAVLREELDDHGLLRRYDTDDGMPREGAFLACTFWLVECLAGQGRTAEAREVFDRALACANDLGLYPEEAGEGDEPLGNFPQALTHLAHVEAALALEASWKSQ